MIELSPLRILQITNHFPPHFIGGDALYSYQISKELSLLGHKVSVMYDKTSYYICTRNKRIIEERFDTPKNLHILPIQFKYGGEFFSFSGSCLFFNPLFYLNLTRLVKKERFDLVHLHNVSWIGLTPLLVKGLKPTPKVYTAHDYWLVCPKLDLTTKQGSFCLFRENCTVCVPPSLSLRATIQKQSPCWSRLIEQISTIICVSEFQASVFSDRLPNANLEVIHNFVDSKKIRILNEIKADEISCFNQKYKIDANAKIVLFVGKIVTAKGFFVLLRSFAEAITSVPNCVLCVVGQCYDFKDIEIQSKKLGIGSRLRFLGKMEEGDLMRAYKRADILTLPSLWPEPCPLVLLEAMAARKPIVASRIGGIPEIVQHGITGFLVPPNDVHALAESLIDLLVDASKSKKMGEKGYELLLKRFSFENHIKRLLEIYIKSMDS